MPRLRTKSIHAPQSLEDGLRICVMSRLTENDGKTPVDEWVRGKAFHIWAKHLAPPDSLVAWWYREGAKEDDWERFERRYLAHIQSNTLEPSLYLIGELASQHTTTLLCVEKDPQYCHRRLLAEEIQRHNPTLQLYIA